MLFLLLACTGPEENEKPVEAAPLLFGEGGDANSVTWTSALGPDDDLSDPRDLGFDEDGRLWVANREDDRTFIVTNPGGDQQESERRRDERFGHFMEETAALSFDGAGQFGSCGESRNEYNDTSMPNDFMGPVLWSTDLSIFGEVDPIGLGSHLDMLHESPNCVGIAWETDNIYWVFDGHNGHVVRYDFQGDHGPGMDDHSDGIIDRFVELEVEFVEEAPGHMMMDHDTGILYVADTGNGRVLWLDTTSGEQGERLSVVEPGTKHFEWEGADWGVLVEGLDHPGALAIADGTLYVGEWATGVIHAFDLDGNALATLDTGWGEGALYAVEVGPDGKLWAIDNASATVYRIDVE